MYVRISLVFNIKSNQVSHDLKEYDHVQCDFVLVCRPIKKLLFWNVLTFKSYTRLLHNTCWEEKKNSKNIDYLQSFWIIHGDTFML